MREASRGPSKPQEEPMNAKSLSIIQRLSDEERRHIASWAAKTSRTEEWTGAEVLRLLSVPDHDTRFGRENLLRQASEELNHARMYAAFAQQFKDGVWLAEYAGRSQNFTQASFTAILRTLDTTPLLSSMSRIPFLTGVFFLDLAGLMTVNVYEESPFEELQEIALQIRADEGRHVHDGREWLMQTVSEVEGGQAFLQEAVKRLLPQADAFFGGDDSPVQATLRKVGIRSVPNAQLKEKFRQKVTALLHLV
jgi:1,2-phenylacetyl-CoA epoxidase catalytic subunit